MRPRQRGDVNTTQPPVLLTPARRRLLLFLKVGGIGFLILLLHIPLLMTYGVLRERQQYQRQAQEEIASLWGRRQVITGPVLMVPYAKRVVVQRSRIVDGRVQAVDVTELSTSRAYFLPEQLEASGAVDTELRHRGIYDTVVYGTTLKLAGQFRPDFAAAGIDADEIYWAKAEILLGVSDLHGVRTVSPLRLAGGQSADFETASGLGSAALPLAAKVASVTSGASLEFSVDVGVQGSERLEIVPVGKTTKVELRSRWPDPSFTGSFLPVTRQVGPGGFTAEWQISPFSRGFASAWGDRMTKTDEMMSRLSATTVGVKFAQLVDGYSMAERAQKYGVLFFVLIFTVFFLFEIMAQLRIHPLQYAMVGAALCLFFLGFLALSEFLVTGLAYTVAAGACTLLISAYSWTFLQAGTRTATIGGGLAATYGYLYFVLKSQDYALVAGAAALFAMLAIVMFATRRINWYELDADPRSQPEAAGR